MVVVALSVVLHNAALRRDLYTQLLVYTFQVYGLYGSVKMSSSDESTRVFRSQSATDATVAAAAAEAKGASETDATSEPDAEVADVAAFQVHVASPFEDVHWVCRWGPSL